MKPINLIPILLLSLIFFGFDDSCGGDSPKLTLDCRGVRPDAPTENGFEPASTVIPAIRRTAERPESDGNGAVKFPTSGNDSAVSFNYYYHPWLEYPYQPDMQ